MQVPGIQAGRVSADLPWPLDEGWLEEFRRWYDQLDHGGKSEAAEGAGVKLWELSRLYQGTRAPVRVLVGVADYMRVAPPRALVGELQHRALVAINRVRRDATDADAELLVRRIEEAAEGLVNASRRKLDALAPLDESRDR